MITVDHKKSTLHECHLNIFNSEVLLKLQIAVMQVQLS